MAALCGRRARIFSRNTDINALATCALAAGRAGRAIKTLAPARAPIQLAGSFPEGISVVIPSRNGKSLLEAALPGVERELAGIPSEVLIADNGSTDGTASSFPRAIVDVSPRPLSFARAVNRGIRRARYSHVCLLNNDMQIEPGFFRALQDAFARVPDLFCATAQIFFPPGVRREETGKAVMRREEPADFPVRCDEPVPGEDHSYVLYGSGGCSLYDTRMLRALGGAPEIYEPAYVEDLDLGFRAWAQGWPTVFVEGARVEHRHRATTSRYYTDEQLDRMLEVNYLRFLITAVRSPALFAKLWKEAIERLRLLSAAAALRFATWGPLLTPRPVETVLEEEEFLALTRGGVLVFHGRARTGKPVLLCVAGKAELPASPGDAYDLALIYAASGLEAPPRSLLDHCIEAVSVTGEPAVFRAALRQVVRKWRPVSVEVEPEIDQYRSYAIGLLSSRQ